MRRETLTTILALVITGVWTATGLSSIVTHDYTALSVVTPVMLIVTGFLFGFRVTKGKNGNSNGDGQ